MDGCSWAMKADPLGNWSRWTHEFFFSSNHQPKLTLPWAYWAEARETKHVRERPPTPPHRHFIAPRPACSVFWKHVNASLRLIPRLWD